MIRIVLLLVILLGAGYIAWHLYLFRFPKMPKAKNDSKIIVTCIGDSTTFGTRKPLQKVKSYPIYLQNLLGDNYEVLNFGLPGRTLSHLGDTPYWKDKFFEGSQTVNSDIVIIMLGTNDSKKQNWCAKVFKEDLQKLIKIYQNLPTNPQVVLVLPMTAYPKKNQNLAVFGITPDILNKEIPEIIYQIVQENTIQTIDLHTFTAGHPEWFADGVHPNSKGYQNIAKYIIQNLSL